MDVQPDLGGLVFAPPSSEPGGRLLVGALDELPRLAEVDGGHRQWAQRRGDAQVEVLLRVADVVDERRWIARVTACKAIASAPRGGAGRAHA